MGLYTAGDFGYMLIIYPYTEPWANFRVPPVMLVSRCEPLGRGMEATSLVLPTGETCALKR